MNEREASRRHGQEEGFGRREDPDPRGRCHPGTSGGYRPRPARRGDHGLLQGVQRQDRGAEGHHRAGRDHRLRGPLVHLHPEDPADVGAHQAGRRSRQGVPDPRRRPSPARSPTPRSRRSPRSRCPTSTPTTSRPPSSRSPAPPARWASRSSDPPARHRRAVTRPGRPRPAGPPHAHATPVAGRARHEGAVMAKHGKKYTDATTRFDRDQLHTSPEAVDLVKSLATAKFDETVELAVRLGVDPRKADQMVRGTVALPSGTGTDVRVAVFAQGDAAAEAREAGADIVGADDLIAQVEGGMLDFDVAIATPDLMPQVGKLGRVARPPWPDAEPQDRHRHHRRRQGRHRLQGRQGRVPHRPLRQRARPDRQGQLRARRPSPPTCGPCSTSSSGPSRPPPRAATSSGSSCPPPWARASSSTRPDARHRRGPRLLIRQPLEAAPPGRYPRRALARPRPGTHNRTRSARRRHPVPLGA